MMLLPDIYGRTFFDDMFYGLDRSLRNVAKKLPTVPTTMKTDIKETETSYELDVTVPGYKKEDVKIALKDGYLTISASTSNNVDETDNDGKYIRRERSFGSCSRSFYVGDEMTRDDIKAKLNDGILHISVPKKEESKKEEEDVTIPIE